MKQLKKNAIALIMLIIGLSLHSIGQESNCLPAKTVSRNDGKIERK